MGPSDHPTNLSPNQARTRSRQRKRPRRQPRRRRCLLKGCEKRYRPRRARQRYCSPECREAARAWSHWKAQHRYRATAAGKQKRNGQSRRYRERVRNRKPAEKQAVPETARVISIEFFSCSCDRPGCYVEFDRTRRSPLRRFCLQECRHALERVRERERR